MEKLARFIALPLLSILISSCGPPYETDTKKLFPDGVPVSESYQVGGRTIHYRETGQPGKTPVIFIHGTPGSWKAFSIYLAAKNLTEKFHLIAVDRPGFGDSGTGGLVLSLAGQSALLEPLLDLDKKGCGTILVGHSLGASVAMRMAMDFPDRVAGVLLIAASLDPKLEKPRWYNRLADWPIVRPFVPDKLLLANREVDALSGELQRMLPLWSSIHLPVTLIQGDQDKLVDPANAKFAQNRLDGELKLVRVAGAGHFILWKQPDLIEKELLDLAVNRLKLTTSQPSCAKAQLSGESPGS